MRISLIYTITTILFINVLHATEAIGQTGLDTKIALNLKNVPLKEVLKRIEEKTGVGFVYANIKNTDQIVSVRDVGRTARTILLLLLQQNQLTMMEQGSLIIIKNKPAPVKQAKPGSIVGYVKDKENSKTLPYATVMLKGPNRKFITDVNGYFIIENVAVGKATFIVSYIGYNSNEFTVNIENGKTTNVDFSISGLNTEMKGITVNGISRGIKQHEKCRQY